MARRLWGERAESSGYAWASLARTGAVVAFGTDAPIEPFDPWPGIALAVRREDPRWPAGTPPFGPDEALSLDRALAGGVPGPGALGRASWTADGSCPVTAPTWSSSTPRRSTSRSSPAGRWPTARPTMVLMDGEVVFER